MRSAGIRSLFAVTCLILLLAACREKEAEQQDDGLVLANQAYREYFGPPPQGEKGRAFARVGFLPLQADSQKVQPLPLFLFTRDNQLRLILERLISDEFLLAKAGPLYRPFPAALDLTVEPTAKGTLVLRLATAETWPEADRAAAGRALAETALQFPEVEKVRIFLHDDPLPGMPASGYAHQPERIVEPGPPQLLLIAGAWEGDAAHPEELLIEFDRPVTVESVAFKHEDGTHVKGEYFTSIFEMAVVVRPEDPSLFREGSLMRVEWHVVDALGRSARGEKTAPLQRFVH